MTELSLRTLFFYLFAFWAVVSALAVITRRNPIHSALWLIGTLLCVAAIFIISRAEFLAMVQLLVYAGGIMVMYLFVIMLVSLGPNALAGRIFHRQSVAAVMIALAIIVLVGVAGPHYTPGASGKYSPAAVAKTDGNAKAVGMELYTTYVYPFEVASVLLVVAALGVIVLTRRDLPKPKPSQEARE